MHAGAIPVVACAGTTQTGARINSAKTPSLCLSQSLPSWNETICQRHAYAPKSIQESCLWIQSLFSLTMALYGK